MKRTATLSIVFLTVASGNACVTTTVRLLGPPNKYPPVPAEEVRVFMAREEIAELGYEYESVGVLFTSGDADFTSRAGMLRSAREKAGEIGANGLILGEINEPSLGERLAGTVTDLDFFVKRRSQMMAIRWWPAEEHPGSSLSYQDSLMTMAPDAGDVYTFPNSDNRYGYIYRAVSALDLHQHSARREGDVLLVTFNEARLRVAITRIDNEPVQIRILSDDPELVAAFLDALDEARAEQVSENEEPPGSRNFLPISDDVKRYGRGVEGDRAFAGVELSLRSSKPGRRGIWITSRDRVGGEWSESVQLTDSGCFRGDWSSDGSKIVCDWTSGIKLFSRSGELLWHLERDFDAGVPGMREPTFSADGSTIYAYGLDAEGSQGIWAIPTEGGAPRLVIENHDESRWFLRALQVHGDRIYLSVAEYESDIWVMDLEY